MKKEEFVKLLKNKGLQFIETEGKIKVGGWLDLRGTGITSLPDNLVVGGSLDLRGTCITSLPDNLAVGGLLDLRGTGITDISHVNTDFKVDITKKIWEGKLYINCDGIFAKVESHHGNVWKVRKIAETESFYIVSDGAGNYAHGDTIEEARKDLVYKITGRDKSDYEGLPSDHIFTFEEAVKCYRTITGACAFGTRDFVENRLGEKKEKYSIEEIARLTEGEYGNMSFREFFNVNK